MNSDCAATPVFRETNRQRYGKLKYPLAWTIESESAYTYDEWVKELMVRMKDEVKQIMEKNWGVQFEVSLQMRYHLPDGTDKAKCVSGGRFRITSIEQLPRSKAGSRATCVSAIGHICDEELGQNCYVSKMHTTAQQITSFPQQLTDVSQNVLCCTT